MILHQVPKRGETHMPRFIRSLALTAVLISAPVVILSQTGAAPKPTLTKADYAKFESIGGTTLSPDGKWIAYVVSKGERAGGGGRGGNGPAGDLHYRAITSGDDKVVPGSSSGPTFTSNSRWLLYTVAPSGGRGGRGTGRGAGAAGDAGRGAPAPTPSIGAIDLTTGATVAMQDVQSYSLSSDGQHVAMRRPVPEGSQNRASGLVIRDLATNSDVSFGNVAESAWSDDGPI